LGHNVTADGLEGEGGRDFETEKQKRKRRKGEGGEAREGRGGEKRRILKTICVEFACNLNSR